VSSFFDTNVLVYAFLDAAKRERALSVLADGGMISAQVLNEFVNVARKKYRRGWQDIEAGLAVMLDQFGDVIPLTSQINARAVTVARDHGLSFHDALIAAAALEAGCDTLYSEDLQHGGNIDGLSVVNPFAA
jgi:predicted nucleic acid-binding protein